MFTLVGWLFFTNKKQKYSEVKKIIHINEIYLSVDK